MLTGCFGQADRFRQARPVQTWCKPPRLSSGRVKHTQSCNFHDHERREPVLDTRRIALHSGSEVVSTDSIWGMSAKTFKRPLPPDRSWTSVTAPARSPVADRHDPVFENASFIARLKCWMSR
jgi:hypothetical protein